MPSLESVGGIWHVTETGMTLTQRAKPEHLWKVISFCLAGMEREVLGEPVGRENTQQGELGCGRTFLLARRLPLIFWAGWITAVLFFWGGGGPDTCAFEHRRLGAGRGEGSEHFASRENKQY